MKKVFFVIPTMGGGGAERVFLHILKHADRGKFRPVLVLFEKKGEYLEQIPGDVTILELKQPGNRNIFYGTTFLKMALRLALILRRERPDMVLSFMWYTNLISVVARRLSGLRVPVAVSERYSLIGANEGFVEERIRRGVVRHVYRYADAAIVNSFAMKEQLRRISGLPEEKIAVIYNPVDVEAIRALSRADNADLPARGLGAVVAGMGRLTPQKGFAYLIRAVAVLESRSVPCTIWILGDGPERPRLERLAADLGVRDRVRFLGFQGNPYRSIVAADVFALPSLYEGFPNALLEAMALGVPVVATRCPTGPEEIVESGRNGILVEPRDEIGLANAIAELLQDDAKRREVGDAGRERVRDFSVSEIVLEYEDALMRMVSG